VIVIFVPVLFVHRLYNTILLKILPASGKLGFISPSVINQRIVHDNDQIANVINDLGVSVNVYTVTHKVG
jgi:hypothetical protein